MLHGYFDTPTFTFFDEKNIWTGSLYQKFNYRIVPEKHKPDEEKQSELHVYVWYGLDCFTNVKEFAAEYHEEFSPNGLENVLEKLTAEFEKYKQIRKDL